MISIILPMVSDILLAIHCHSMPPILKLYNIQHRILQCDFQYFHDRVQWVLIAQQREVKNKTVRKQDIVFL